MLYAIALESIEPQTEESVFPWSFTFLASPPIKPPIDFPGWESVWLRHFS